MGLARPTPRPYSEWGAEGRKGQAYTIETEKWALSLREQVCSLTMMMGGRGFCQSGGLVVIFHPFVSMSYDTIFIIPTALFRGVKSSRQNTSPKKSWDGREREVLTISMREKLCGGGLITGDLLNGLVFSIPPPSQTHASTLSDDCDCGSIDSVGAEKWSLDRTDRLIQVNCVHDIDCTYLCSL